MWRHPFQLTQVNISSGTNKPTCTGRILLVPLIEVGTTTSVLSPTGLFPKANMSPAWGCDAGRPWAVPAAAV